MRRPPLRRSVSGSSIGPIAPVTAGALRSSCARRVLDVSALEHSLHQLALRHEVLRRRFPSIDGQPVQAIDEAASLEGPLPVVDLGELAEYERRAEVTRLAEAEAHRPFHPGARAGLASAAGAGGSARAHPSPGDPPRRRRRLVDRRAASGEPVVGVERVVLDPVLRRLGPRRGMRLRETLAAA